MSLSPNLLTLASAQPHKRRTTVDAGPLESARVAARLGSYGCCFNRADAGLGHIYFFHLAN